MAATQPDDWAVHTGAAEFGEELMTLTYVPHTRTESADIQILGSREISR
jgi:hypothetical protein